MKCVFPPRWKYVIPVGRKYSVVVEEVSEWNICIPRLLWPLFNDQGGLEPELRPIICDLALYWHWLHCIALMLQYSNRRDINKDKDTDKDKDKDNEKDKDKNTLPFVHPTLCGLVWTISNFVHIFSFLSTIHSYKHHIFRDFSIMPATVTYHGARDCFIWGRRQGPELCVFISTLSLLF